MNFEEVANSARFTAASFTTARFTTASLIKLLVRANLQKAEICHSETAKQTLTGHQNVE